MHQFYLTIQDALRGIDLTSLDMLLGAALPPLIAIIQKPTWSSRLRAVVTAVVCVVVGLLTATAKGDLDGLTGATSIIKVFIAAIAAYHGFWQKTGTTEKIEAATS